MGAYTPTPPPNSGNAALERYIQDELFRISNSIVDVNDVAFGGMGFVTSNGDNLDTCTPTRKVVKDWDEERPLSGAEGCEVNLVDGTITVSQSGTYFTRCVIDCKIVLAFRYWIELFVNGSATGIEAVCDTLNLNEIYQVALHGLVDLEAGDVLDLRASVNSGSRRFDAICGDWTVIRVGG